MRVFVSYASEQRGVAERLAIGLRGADHDVFFDRDALPPGGSYDDRIRAAVRRSHLVVFLVSRESLSKGAYSLTELGFAQQRWPDPSGRVLPVLVDDTPIDTLPAYLRAVSVLQPAGDLVAEVLDAAARHASERRARRAKRGALAAAVAIVTAGLWFWWSPAAEKQSVEGVRVSRAPAGASPTEAFRFDVSLRNGGDDRLETVDVAPRADRTDVRFPTSTEWFTVNPGETRRVTVAAGLDKPPAVSSFNWRMCWGFAPRLDLELRAKETSIDAFLARHRREVCDGWRPWTVP
jgi:hypothetical protein